MKLPQYQQACTSTAGSHTFRDRPETIHELGFGPQAQVPSVEESALHIRFLLPLSWSRSVERRRY